MSGQQHSGFIEVASFLFALWLQTQHHGHSFWSKWCLCPPPFKDTVSRWPFTQRVLFSREHLLCPGHGLPGGKRRHCCPVGPGEPGEGTLFHRYVLSPHFRPPSVELPEGGWDGRLVHTRAVSGAGAAWGTRSKGQGWGLLHWDLLGEKFFQLITWIWLSKFCPSTLSLFRIWYRNCLKSQQLRSISFLE